MNRLPESQRSFNHNEPPSIAERMLGLVVLTYIALVAFATCTVALVAILE